VVVVHVVVGLEAEEDLVAGDLEVGDLEAEEQSLDLEAELVVLLLGGLVQIE
jgi:hypothetical protein